MRDGDLYRIDRILSDKIKPNTRAYIDEKNLQIHIKEAASQDPALSFNKIVNDVGGSLQVSETQAGAEQLQESERLQASMQEAQKSYEAMMEFHNQIREAFQQIVEMQR